MSSVTENALREIASAYAQAVGILEASIKITLERGDSLSTQEREDLLKRGLEKSKEIIDNA
jgi:arabinogalactan endo-1,4-beta-galactosidase